MNTAARELEVPSESLVSAMALAHDGMALNGWKPTIRAIATPVVTAELRRLADAAEWRISPEALRDRADELEAGQ